MQGGQEMMIGKCCDVTGELEEGHVFYMHLDIT
jgi:hypothetical protein